MNFEYLIPQGKSGDWHIKKDSDGIRLTQDYFSKDAVIWMSQYHWEKATHKPLQEKARGDVLLAGLGLGYDVWLLKDKVNSITVVEKEQDVINLVWEYVKNDKTKLIHGRILNFMEWTKRKFDLIWFDIFPVEPYLLPEQTRILSKAGEKILNTGGEILFWNSQPPIVL